MSDEHDPFSYSEAVEQCLAHIDAAVRQGQMRGFDQVSLSTALLAQGLLLAFGGKREINLDRKMSVVVARYSMMLTEEILFERGFLKVERLGGDASKLRAMLIEERASRPERLPHNVALWAREIAARICDQEEGRDDE